ncbi:oxidoreductase, putative [Ichthyophthirius multifiliis]|uniref:Oxidoreductase, putative n=1 Tax=Ichthyophthirius multifiliis TaxID=5932 RepID=G0QWB5_ICHMU|nr:oxidoreductase, putative [Ichthyophthirius multifiliis]EGR30487.1 oxidoreductase, putative [Ichthyophthirius multifiliis]|eukprot:XP_004032074.1 oxidoreductase, putative [Ichthyophthirius multifiliis]
MFSLWDKQSFLLNNDVIIIGGGISGLSCASSILETYPEKKVIILERGQTPQGASTKNGGEHQGRILVGGGLDQEYINESSCDLVNSQVLQNKILNFLNECILLNTPYEIDFNWSGIMAISKKDITLIDYLIDKESENVFYVGRYCGRGMILSSIAGEEMRNLVYQGKSRL